VALEEALEAAVGGAYFWLDAEAKGVAAQGPQMARRVTGVMEGGLDGGEGLERRFLASLRVPEDGAGDDSGFSGFEFVHLGGGRWFDVVPAEHSGEQARGSDVFAKMDQGSMHGALGPGGVGHRGGDA
jgi:hypothetical protein